ncbi:metallophosphoesterase family protein [[Limnothrix rosea] IAM M-220]|uniref:metallophosphoesterase family protein n=1 Tax=[Limnothrix rosea] IAM M-220 TaxID=454133 RepID=UPI00095B6C1D|nr:metallophosphoesterase [[Limnothrix rosea] IAM M-220]OKH18080.1 hypothetical protein NIES208_06975 [[Limnothrix rosea] IAM M-220]
MKFVIDSTIARKIQAMQERIRWQHPMLKKQGIDQTHLVLDDNNATAKNFSFLVIGDSGTGKQGSYDPQYAIAAQMQTQREGASFVMHTGDVVYLVGSSEYYTENFIKPYRDFLKGGDKPQQIAYDKMVFNLPFLPVLGNHDYYNLPWIYGLISGVTKTFRKVFSLGSDWDIGWHGSFDGEAYSRAFIDCLDRFFLDWSLEKHLEKYYRKHEIHPGETKRCLHYDTNEFTRLPNRYYTFRVGSVDFFALDSNTFNHSPKSLGKPLNHEKQRQLQDKLVELQNEQETLQASLEMMGRSPDYDSEDEQQVREKLEQIDEIQRDIHKQLNPEDNSIDLEQLQWLETELIASWQNETVTGRVLFFHHPPYVTESTKWYQGQTHAVRDNLQAVLDNVGVALNWNVGDRPLVDLVINGHAHCMEHIETWNTGHGDSFTNWIVAGGSGYSLRRQRREGNVLHAADFDATSPAIAESKVFFGKTGKGKEKQQPYSFLRIDVDIEAATPPKFTVRPFISERYQKSWKHYPAEPFTIQSVSPKVKA